jgi:hypothetical protein
VSRPSNLLTGVGGGAKSYDGGKAWSSINHSILSVLGLLRIRSSKGHSGKERFRD